MVERNAYSASLERNNVSMIDVYAYTLLIELIIYVNIIGLSIFNLSFFSFKFDTFSAGNFFLFCSIERIINMNRNINRNTVLILSF